MSPRHDTSFLHLLQDRSPQLIQGENLIRQTRPCHDTRHAPHDTACLILHEDLATCLLDRFTTPYTVLSLTCQHHSQRVRTVLCCNRTEQDLDCWAARVFRWPLMHT